MDLNCQNQYISGHNLLIIRFEHKNRIFLPHSDILVTVCDWNLHFLVAIF